MISRHFKKRYSIFGLGLLMTISLLGIVAVQYLWIRQSLTIQQEQLQSSAYIAVNRAAARIEREQSAAMALNPFFSHHPFPPKQFFQPFVPPQRGEGKARIEAHFNVNGKEFNKIIDWDEAQTEDDGNNLNSALSQVEDSIRHMMGSLSDEDNSLMDIFRQMAREFETRQDPSQGLFKPADIDNILKQELGNMGITIPAEYAIVEHNSGDVFEKSKNFSLTNDNHIEELDVAMYPNIIFRMWNDLRLKVQLPFSTLYLMRTQISLLSISTLFTLFIIGTFLVTMRTIIHQKKVSDIKSDFINNMTHEFKTPIATISLATDSIATPSVLGRPDVIKSFLGIIKEENTRMNSQVERILQMALIDKKDFNMMTSPTDANALIRKAVQNMSLFISESGGTVDLQLCDEPLVAELDTVHFTNVVVNLIENAIKYSKSSPEVTVTTRAENHNITVSVRDKGIGMTKEQQGKMFEKFYRAAGGNIHNVKGFGLGLSYVKAVVDAHGGTISVKSKLNEGSEFTISIPSKN